MFFNVFYSHIDVFYNYDGKGGEGERRGREEKGREGGLCSSNMSFKKTLRHISGCLCYYSQTWLGTAFISSHGVKLF